MSHAEDAPVRGGGSAPDALPPVLLVEDDDVHALLIEGSLAHARLSNPVLRARSGEDAMDHLRRAATGERAVPALILLDLELPGRSGLEVLAGIRQLNEEVASAPVIMMTASEDGGSIARAKELGVRGYLIKPVAFDALAGVIHRLGLRWALLRPEGR